MIKRGISRADIAAQCTRHCAAFALRSPPQVYCLFSPSKSVVMQLCHNCHVSNPLFLQSLLLHFCLSPHFIVPAHLLFSLSLRWTQYYVVHVSSPCHLVYLYMVFDSSCIVNSIQPPTECHSP